VNSRGFWGRGIVLAVLLVVGLGAVAAGGFGLYTEVTPQATAAEAGTAGPQTATRWLQLTAGQIFPRTIIYKSTTAGVDWPAHLVGIAPRATCLAATDPQIGPALAQSGCRALLRATYADASGTLLTTVGIAVMPGATAAAHAFSAIHNGQNAGVRTVSFAGTISGQFGNGKRTLIQTEYQGSYIFFFATGFADGRLTHAAAGYPAIQDLGDGIVNALENTLSQTGNPCQEKDVRC